jgi:hypothetical protein
MTQNPIIQQNAVATGTGTTAVLLAGTGSSASTATKYYKSQKVE